jgi:hypothetical protein
MDVIDTSVAYDGSSKRRPRRALSPLERDILCRILDDIFHELRATNNLDSLQFVRDRGGIRMYAHEIPMLVSVRKAISPRPDGE